MTKKKFRKLLRDPKLFFNDMYTKRSIQIKKHLPIKHNGYNAYTIVSAVYNVAPYLDDFFNSITKQTLSFKKYIHIILVDDGSTDASAEIIKKWQQKYPKNIHYFYKENGGQASARNLGLEHVKTEWVTFIDPDDFISADYFYNIDTFIHKNKNLSLIGCPLVFYFEDEDMFKDTHPLRYRFSKGDVVFPVSNLKNHLQLSASTAFFKIKNIKTSNLSFDERMKPSFEDAKFVTDYLLNTNLQSNVGFISNVSYFYRKRSDGTSTLDSAWNNPLLFSRVIEEGCIQILRVAQRKFGSIPEHIQRITLYHIIWYFNRIVNNPTALSHLSKKQQEEFVKLLHEMFAYIDDKTILRFNLAGTWFLQKVALLGLFKKEAPPSQIAYIEDYDLKKNQILIKYFSNFSALEEWRINNKEITPSYKKEVTYDFLGNLYTKEYRTWIQCSEDELLELFLDNKKVKLTFLGKQFDKLSIGSVKEHFQKISTVRSNSWILMDRDNQADDNAEHLYRYISQNHPNQEIYFALNKTSSDWKRLEKEGFNLLEFGSNKFENTLRNCSKIISSHVDGYITHYFKDNSLLDKDYIFLQHGITKDDLSNWLNTKKIACFITATNDEYHSIVDNHTAYKFGKKEVKLTGFPRYDRLLNGNNINSKQILVMPTWRSSIVGAYIKGTERARNPDFMKTNYAKHWHSFMNNEILNQLHHQGYNIIFAPHPSIQEYMDEFTVPDFVKIYSYSEGKIQSLFQNTSILVTDYSSVAFDVAYLNKAILYYHFDYDEVFSGNHTYQKGYFDYERDGFGEIAYTETELLEKLNNLIRNNGKLLNTYQDRINHTFAFRDNKNCERVYHAIINLDMADTTDNRATVKDMITHAENHKAWGLAATRLLNLIDNYSLTEEEYKDYTQRYLMALYEAEQFNNLLNFLEEHQIKEAPYWQAKVELQIGNTAKAAKFFADTLSGTNEDNLLALFCAALNEDLESVNILSHAVKLNLSTEHMPLLLLAEQISQKKYFIALTLIETCLETFDTEDKNVFKLELLAAYLCMRLNNLQQAHKYLVRYEGHRKNDPSCRIAIARLAKLRQDKEKLFTQLNRAFGDNLLLIPHDLVPAYLEELKRQDNTQAADYLLAQFREKYPNSKTILLYQAEQFFYHHRWQQLVDLLEKHNQISERALYLYTYALYRLNIIEQANDAFNRLAVQNTFDYWKLVAEAAEKNEDKELLKESLQKQLTFISN